MDRCTQLYSLNTFLDQELDTYPLKETIWQVEYAVRAFNPTIVYTNFIGDLNRDHRIVAEATMVACRPYKPNAPKVFMYAIPGTTEIGLRPFNPTKCNVIDQKKKEELIRLWYPDEMVNGREAVKYYEEFEKWPK